MRTRRLVLLTLSLAFGALLTWFAFRGTDWQAVGRAMQGARWGWVIAAGACFLTAHVVRAQRFGVIVRSTMDARYRQLFAAMQIGSFFQMVLPFRPGSFVRAIVLSRLLKRPFSGCYGAVVLDRVPELAVIGLFALAVIAGLPDQPTFTIAPDVLDTKEPVEVSSTLVESTVSLIGVMLTLRVTLLVSLFAKREFVLRVVGWVLGFVSISAAEYAQRILGHFADSLAVLRSGFTIVLALLWTLLDWSLYALAYVAMLLAFGYTVPWYGAMLLAILTAVALVVYGAPGLVGQFHLAVVMGLVIALPGMPTADMKAIAILSHIVFILVLTAGALMGLVAEQSRLFEAREPFVRRQKREG